jgi:cholesterol transport system auxiliary component
MMRRGLMGGLMATVLATTLAGAGCSVLPTQAYLQRREWPLVVTRPEETPGDLAGTIPTARPGRPRGSVLLLRTIQAGPGLDARGLQTLQPDGSLQTAFYEQWAAPPAQGVDDDLRRWLADSRLFAAVVSTGSRLTADFELEGTLVALNADLGNGTARAALSLMLMDQRAGGARILLERTETASVKLEGTDPPALARAQLAALAAMLRQTEADLAIAVHP